MIDPGIPETLEECKQERQRYKRLIRSLMQTLLTTAPPSSEFDTILSVLFSAEDVYVMLGYLAQDMRRANKSKAVTATLEQQAYGP